MPAAQIKALRTEGRLDEAHSMALAELQAEPNNIWSKRNMSWVLYAQLDAAHADLAAFLQKIDEVTSLELPVEEEMFFTNLSIVISKAARNIASQTPINLSQLHLLFDKIKEVPLVRPSKWYSVLYRGFHKGMKDSYRYLEFADWWDFRNFLPEDYEKDTLENGREIMALVEQATIAYAKHLLPLTQPDGTVEFSEKKVELFMPFLDSVIESHGDYQYPLYFKTKLLLALGNEAQTLASFVPFARKKKNDFWVWELLAEIFKNDPEKVLACYCRALTCRASEDFLIKINQKLAAILVQKEMYNEAKTEIEKLTAVRSSNGWAVPSIVNTWKNQDWFETAIAFNDNSRLYRKHIDEANNFLYADIEEERVFVNFVNADRKILNFINGSSYGFFKYEFLTRTVAVGDVLVVRFNGNGSADGAYKVFTLKKITDDVFKNQFVKDISGNVRKRSEKDFGFLGDVYLPPNIVQKYSLTDNKEISIRAIKTFDRKKNAFGWSFCSVNI